MGEAWVFVLMASALPGDATLSIQRHGPHSVYFLPFNYLAQQFSSEIVGLRCSRPPQTRAPDLGLPLGRLQARSPVPRGQSAAILPVSYQGGQFGNALSPIP
jgi:hypothetical protein